MQTHLTLSLLATLSLGGLVACSDDPPSPSAVRGRITADLPHVLGESKAAVDGSTAVLPAMPAQLDLAMQIAALKYPALGPARSAMHGSRLPADPATDGGFDPDATAAWLNDHIFTDANHLGGGIFKVPAELACTTESIDDTGAVTSTVDAECAQHFDEVQLRIRVEQNDTTLAFAIQVDANHDEPVAFTLRHDAIGMTLNLDDADAAMTALAPVFGEEAPNVDLAGQVTALLEVPGTAHVKASLTIDRDISIKFASTGQALDSDGAFRFASAASDVVAIELDGTAKSGSLDLGVATTTAHLPGSIDPAFPEPSTDLDLPGVTAHVAFGEGQPLAVTGISLGNRTTTLSRGGQIATTFDLNPDAGRTFAATLTGDPAADTSIMTVTPKLDARTSINHTVLGDTAPRYDVTQYLLDGAANPAIESSATTSQLRVVAGTLTIVTNPAEYGVSASAGSCVSQTEVVDAMTGESYEQWTAGTCQ